jgi:hypothetical protein
LEIGRRGYNVIIKKNKMFYPKLTVKTIKDQWKKYLTEEVKCWKDLHLLIKNSKMKYRVSLDDLIEKSYRVLSLKTEKSLIKTINFI